MKFSNTVATLFTNAKLKQNVEIVNAVGLFHKYATQALDQVHSFIASEEKSTGSQNRNNNR